MAASLRCGEYRRNRHGNCSDLFEEVHIRARHESASHPKRSWYAYHGKLGSGPSYASGSCVPTGSGQGPENADTDAGASKSHCTKAQQQTFLKCNNAAAVEAETRALQDAKCKCCSKAECTIPACKIMQSFGVCRVKATSSASSSSSATVHKGATTSLTGPPHPTQRCR